MSFMDAREHGSKTGGGGVASAQVPFSPIPMPPVQRRAPSGGRRCPPLRRPRRTTQYPRLMSVKVLV